LQVTGISGGYTGKGFKNIIPHQATAKINLRFVADQQPDNIAEKFQRFIEKITPPTVQATLTFHGGSTAILVDTNTAAIQAAIAAYEKGWGADPVFMRIGGSIPIVQDFQTKLSLPIVLMGFGLDTDGLHGPNEHLSIEMFHRGIDTAIQFLEEIAATGK
jgi:acetylornithine deacetylase/succinyl-diaminopimelate desuccinylase-like protein